MKRRWLYGMSDERLKERLAALPPEGRLRVLLHVALGWQRLRGGWRGYGERGLTQGT